MFKRLLLAATVAVAFALSLTVAFGDPLPKSTAQPRTDTFEYSANVSMDRDNPVSAKIRATSEVRWTYKVMPGCRNGTWPQDLGRTMGDLFTVTDVRSIYVEDGTQDLTIRSNCGSSFTSTCGTGAAACLGRGFPRIVDIDLSDSILDWPEVTRVSIICHEYCGHALATFNEQYCAGLNSPVPGCAAWGTQTPNWFDIMNTGELSRHYIAVDNNFVARWGRVMGAPAPVTGFFGRDGNFLYVCGDLIRATGIWISGYGSASVSQLAVYGVNKCRYLDVGASFRIGLCVTFDVGNAVDWKDDRLRTDRQVC